MKQLAYAMLTFVLFLSTFQTSVARTYKIYIDPGHYEGDDRTPTEIETTLAVAQKLYKLLKTDTSSGVSWKILMSRDGPDSRRTNPKPRFELDTPTHRAIDANEFKADLFLSIHCNGDGPGATGTETFWCDSYTEAPKHPIPKNAILPNENKKKSEYFADLIQKHMAKRGDWRSRHGGEAVLDHTYREFQNRYPGFQGHLPILLYLRVPGCLNEIGFVTNPTDKEKLESDYWRNRFAEAYRDAIYEYFDLELPSYFDIILVEGWNIISVPGVPVSSYPWSTIIRSDLLHTPVFYRFDAVEGWEAAPEVKFSEGYLIHSSRNGGEKIHISYLRRAEYTINLEKGLNLIGSVSDTADFKRVRNRLMSPRLQRLNTRAWKLEEEVSGTIRPGKGYFVEAFRSTQLTVSANVRAAPAHVHGNSPGQTQILANYPNPFNPETWIPYQLSEASNVTVSIYAVDGKLVRTLALGHQPAGVYRSRSRALHWDGRNAFGELVASGLYFYTFTAGDFSATRKMLIRK